MQNNDAQARVEELRVAHAKIQQSIVWITEYEGQLTEANKRIAELDAKSLRMDATHLKYEQDTAKSILDFEVKMQALLAQVMQNNANLLVIERAKCASQQSTCIAELDDRHKKFVCALSKDFEEKLGAQVERSNLAVYMESKARAKLLSLNVSDSLVDMWSDEANGAGPSLETINAFLDGEDAGPCSCSDNTRLFKDASFSGASVYAHEPSADGGLGFFEDQAPHTDTPKMPSSPNGICPFNVQAEMYPNSTNTATGTTLGIGVEEERDAGEQHPFKAAKHLSDQQAGVQSRSVTANPGWKPAPRKLYCVSIALPLNPLDILGLTLAMMFRALHVPHRRSGLRQVREKLLHVARQNLRHQKKRRRNCSLRSQVRRWRRGHQCQGALHQERPYRAHSPASGEHHGPAHRAQAHRAQGASQLPDAQEVEYSFGARSTHYMHSCIHYESRPVSCILPEHYVWTITPRVQLIAAATLEYFTCFLYYNELFEVSELSESIQILVANTRHSLSLSLAKL
jgi:hypothetical protein